MGLRGPAPKPTDIRLLEGNLGHKPINKHEPIFARGVPERPKRMSRQAKQVWDELVGEMAASQVLRTIDGRALSALAEDEAMLVEIYGGLRRAEKELAAQAKKEGKTLPGGALFSLLSSIDGRRALNSLKEIAARTIVERREFGLTPSSRTRIKALEELGIGLGKPGIVDPIEDALCG